MPWSSMTSPARKPWKGAWKGMEGRGRARDREIRGDDVTCKEALEWGVLGLDTWQQSFDLCDVVEGRGRRWGRTRV